MAQSVFFHLLVLSQSPVLFLPLLYFSSTDQYHTAALLQLSFLNCHRKVLTPYNILFDVRKPNFVQTIYHVFRIFLTIQTHHVSKQQ